MRATLIFLCLLAGCAAAEALEPMPARWFRRPSSRTIMPVPRTPVPVAVPDETFGFRREYMNPDNPEAPVTFWMPSIPTRPCCPRPTAKGKP